MVTFQMCLLKQAYLSQRDVTKQRTQNKECQALCSYARRGSTEKKHAFRKQCQNQPKSLQWAQPHPQQQQKQAQNPYNTTISPGDV